MLQAVMFIPSTTLALAVWELLQRFVFEGESMPGAFYRINVYPSRQCMPFILFYFINFGM